MAKSLSSMTGIEREIRWATVRGARGAARRVMLELSEFNPQTVAQEMTKSLPALELLRLIGDVKDLPQLRVTFTCWHLRELVPEFRNAGH